MDLKSCSTTIKPNCNSTTGDHQKKVEVVNCFRS